MQFMQQYVKKSTITIFPLKSSATVNGRVVLSHCVSDQKKTEFKSTGLINSFHSRRSNEDHSLSITHTNAGHLPHYLLLGQFRFPLYRLLQSTIKSLNPTAKTAGYF